MSVNIYHFSDSSYTSSYEIRILNWLLWIPVACNLDEHLCTSQHIWYYGAIVPTMIKIINEALQIFFLKKQALMRMLLPVWQSIVMFYLWSSVWFIIRTSFKCWGGVGEMSIQAWVCIFRLLQLLLFSTSENFTSTDFSFIFLPVLLFKESLYFTQSVSLWR